MRTSIDFFLKIISIPSITLPTKLTTPYECHTPSQFSHFPNWPINSLVVYWLICWNGYPNEVHIFLLLNMSPKYLVIYRISLQVFFLFLTIFLLEKLDFFYPMAFPTKKILLITSPHFFNMFLYSFYFIQIGRYT